MFDTRVETFEHAGLACEIHWEEDGSFANPREWSNFGTMVCWHPDYMLGDYQITDGNSLGAVENRFHRDAFNSMTHLARYLGIMERAVCVLPLSIYEHSGISMYIGGKHDYPFDSAGWDTTVVGFIYVTYEQVQGEFGLCNHCAGTGESERNVTDSGDYDPAPCEECGGWKLGRSLKEIEEMLRQEVKTYDEWLKGEVYWWCVRDSDGDLMESCGGYIGDIDYVRQEARETAEHLAHDIAVNIEPNFPEGIKCS